MYTDIAKAFDTVSHSKLLLKVEAYGFKSNLLQWIRAFLNDRTQCVYVGLDVSSPKSITSGVPQGSVLGPLLFLLYVNDLPNHVQSPAGIKIFADDTKLYLGYTENQSTPLMQSLINFVHGPRHGNCLLLIPSALSFPLVLVVMSLLHLTHFLVFLCNS